MFSVAITKDKNLWRDVKIDDSRKRLVADNSICECIHAAAVSASAQATKQCLATVKKYYASLLIYSHCVEAKQARKQGWINSLRL